MESLVAAGVDWPATLAAAADRALAAVGELERDRWADDAGLGADGTQTAAVDAAAEGALLAYLTDALPGATICSEEAGVVGGGAGARGPGSGVLLIVDPLDGTNNVLAGLPYWAISIAVAIDGAAVGGLVRNGATGEDVFGWAGRGVWRGGRPVSASGVGVVGDASVALQRPADPAALERSRHLVAACRLPRVLGAAALDLAYVAAGALDGYVNVNVDPALPFGERVVDYAAGAILCEVAGATVTDAAGEALVMDADLDVRAPVVAAATPALHAALLGRLRREGA